MDIKKEQELEDAITNYVESMTREQLETYVAEDKTEYWFESGYINDESDIDEFIQDNPPLPTVSGDDPEALTPVRLDMQFHFNAWLDSVGYTPSDERLDKLYMDTRHEVRTVKDVLYTKFEMEAGYWDSDEFEKNAFDLFKEQYPNDVIYPKQYFPNDDIKLQAKIAQTLTFIGSGEIKLTPDQVTTPDNPDQYEVMKLLFKIKTEKELSSFIRSATIDTNEFSKEGVDELLGQLNNNTTQSLKVSTPNTTKGM
jgi:hypothetical protein